MIEGGGWVGVGDERTRVQAGEAVVWPPDVLHAAWTDGAPMRAIVVELPVPPELLGSGVIEGTRARGRTGRRGRTARPGEGRGRLAPRPVHASRRPTPTTRSEPL